MPAVRLENQRPVFLADRQQIEAKRPVYSPCQSRQPRAGSEILEFQTRNPFLGRYINDVERRNDDHCSLKPGREEADPVVTIEVRSIRWLETQPQTVSGKGDSDDMDNGLGSIRKN